MKKRFVHGNMPIPTDDQSAEVLQPGECPLDRPSSLIPPQFAAIVIFLFLIVLAVRAYQLDTATFQPFTQRVAVVPLVCNDTPRIFPGAASPFTRNGNRLDGCLQQLHFRRGRRVQVVSDRNTLAVHHHHPLRTLSAFGLADAQTPFFAAALLPSANVSAQSNWPFSSNSAKKARQMRSQTPCSSQSRSRRQHVLADEYCLGRSFHRAPERSTQRIPSNTLRLSTGFGPPLADRLNVGKSGSIFCHCSSVSKVLSLAIKNTSMIYGQVKHKPFS